MMSMTTLQLEPLHPFAAEASGIDLSQPLSPAQVHEVEAAMERHAVLVFRGQPLTEDQQIAFARNFGPLDMGLHKVKTGPRRFRHGSWSTSRTSRSTAKWPTAPTPRS